MFEPAASQDSLVDSLLESTRVNPSALTDPDSRQLCKGDKRTVGYNAQIAVDDLQDRWFGAVGRRWSGFANLILVGEMRTLAGQGAIPREESTDAHAVLDRIGRRQVLEPVAVEVGDGDAGDPEREGPVAGARRQGCCVRRGDVVDAVEKRRPLGRESGPRVVFERGPGANAGNGVHHIAALQVHPHRVNAHDGALPNDRD